MHKPEIVYEPTALATHKCKFDRPRYLADGTIAKCPVCNRYWYVAQDWVGTKYWYRVRPWHFRLNRKVTEAANGEAEKVKSELETLGQ